MSVGIIGAGAFGTALAISLARPDRPVALWARDPDHVRDMVIARENRKRLPGAPFPDEIEVTSDNARVAASDTLLFAVPMQTLAATAMAMQSHLRGKALVACCKGVDQATGLGPVETLRVAAPDATCAVLTGPSFAADIARGLPTALTLGCADEATAKGLQVDLSAPNLRIYRTTDVIGAELGGALKNVIAIACGAAIGAGLGESARAAVMTRGYAEMLRMALKMGARPKTLAGLSGLGDLTLTCTSSQSRNYRFGLSLGAHEAFDPTVTVEGAATARAVAQKARELGLDMPITDAVVALLDGKIEIAQAVETLLSRPLKEE